MRKIETRRYNNSRWCYFEGRLFMILELKNRYKRNVYY